MAAKIDITRIVNSSVLQTFPDAFYEATGFATGIHNLGGDLITAIPKDYFCSFCRNMFFSSHGHKQCLMSNRQGDKTAFEMCEPNIYYCHAGLVDVSAPIIVNGEYLGAITFGQLIINKLDDDYRKKVRKNLAEYPEEFQERQMKALEKVPVVSLKQVKGLAQLLSLIANNIVSLIISNIKEKELNIKNNKLISEIKATYLFEKEMRNAQLQLKEVELKMLQAQINPHFLYNTLDSIKWLAVLHGAEDIQQIAVSLGKLLRYSLDREQTNVSLRKEIEKVENYLTIQKIRYGEKLSYFINIEDEVLDFCIPRLLLQPLVENAIQHGLEPKATSGTIWINGWQEDDQYAVLEVVDDGVGMNEELVAELARKVGNQLVDAASDTPTHACSIGLNNVNRRLVFSFGEDAALRIISTEKEGTSVRFKIPKTL